MDHADKKRKIHFLDSPRKRTRYERDEVAMPSSYAAIPRQDSFGVTAAGAAQLAPDIVVNEAAPTLNASESTQDQANEPFLGDVNMTSTYTSDDGEDHYPAPERSDSSLLPDPFTCLIHLTLDGKVLKQTPNLSVSWKDDTAYENAYLDIETASLRCLQGSGELGSRHPFLKHGSCRLISDHRVEQPRPLEKREQWVEVRSVLVNEYRLHSVEGFRLEVARDYSAVQNDPVEEESYYINMQNQIHDKMKHNFNNRKYIPRIDLINIATAANIRRIIESDHPFYGYMRQLDANFDKEEFIRRVQHEAPRLLAIIVYCDMDMKCLKLLMDKGIVDRCLPLDPIHCPDSKYSRKFDTLLENQGSFVAYQFKTEGDHQVVHPKVVVPVLLDKEVDCIGKGGFSRVYKAQIDPDHLGFTKDKSQVFAVKEFREHEKIEKDFNREQSMLQELRRYPHPHVVVHLSSWIQDSKYYLLFPYASCNLRQYMSQVPEPTLKKQFVLWILRQFRGLADAIRHVHNLKDSDRQQHNLAAPRQTGLQQGYHHDIKPENILYFDAKGKDDARLKIADFGLGKVHNLRSGSRLHSRITPQAEVFPTYEAPDGFVNGFTSRPADMWSLGCVFLELLVWIFVPTEPAAGEFPEARIGYPIPHYEKISDDAFWSGLVTEQEKTAALRPGVVQWIQRVETLSSRQRAFQRILECTKELLEPISAKRLTSIHLANRLDALARQAKSDLAEKPDLYLEQDVPFPSEGMLPSKTQPPSPAIRPSLPASPTNSFHVINLPHLALPNGSMFTERASPLMASPMDSPSLQIPVRQRRSSYGLTPTPGAQIAGSYSSMHTILSEATDGSRDDRLDEIMDIPQDNTQDTTQDTNQNSK